MGIVKDVTTTGFFFQVAEPSCHDESHAGLKFDWMAVLPGVYTVDGSTFEAGIMTATGTTGHTSDFETITFAGSYATIPSVVAQIQDASAHAADEEYYINTRHHHLTTTSVGVLINEMANHHSMGGLDLGTTGASIGYVVMEETSSSSIQAKTTETAADCLSADPSATNCRGFTSTHIGGTHEEQATFVFSEALASEGFVFGQTITRNGGDHVTLRLASATGTAAASAVSGATDMTMFLEEPGKCWAGGSDTQAHENEEAASYMVFTATAFADSIAALTATATVSFELQVSSYDQADLPAYGAAIALTLSLDASSVTVAELSTSRRLIEATSATLLVTVTTDTAAVVEAAISTASFSGSVSTELDTAGVTTTLTVDPGTITAVATTCSVTCASVPITVNGMVDNLLRVTHDTTSQHTHHRCYIESPSLACKCSCCNDASSNCNLSSNYQL